VEAELVSSQRDAMARADLEQKHLRIDRGLTEETGELNKIRWRKQKAS
jgi:NTP pyrophosphatase (non-canonical NTP hydrolase)